MKSVTFRYFDVHYVGLTSASSLVQRLISKLTSSAASRMMPINKNESDKSDVISDFSNVGKGRALAGTSIRIVNSRDVPIITEDMLKQNQFKVSSINMNAKDEEKTCLDYFYFCLSDSKLIVTLDSRTSINRFETYVNWILNTKDSGETISFTPTIDTEAISAADLKKITISNTTDVLTTGEDSPDNSVRSKMVNLKDSVLKKLFSESDSLKELMDADICSANLVITFSKPRGMSEDEYRRKTAGAILKPLEDPDSVKFQTKGKKIKGSDVLKTETILVEDDNGAVSEQEIYQKMVQKMNLS